MASKAKDRSKIYRKGRAHFNINEMPARTSTLKTLWGYFTFIMKIVGEVSDFTIDRQMETVQKGVKEKLINIAMMAKEGRRPSESEYLSVMSSIRNLVFLFYEKFEDKMANALEFISGELENLKKENAEVVSHYASAMADLQEQFRKAYDLGEKGSYDEIVAAYNAMVELLDTIGEEIDELEAEHELSELKTEGEELLEALNAA